MDICVRAGCRHFDFSPDAAVQSGLDFFKKNIAEEDIMKNLELMKGRKGISVTYNFFCSHPGQSLADLVKTLLVWFRILTAAFGRVRIGMGWVRILPHTPMHETAISEGIITGDTPLLPKDAAGLKKLFYLKKSLKYFDAVILCACDITEYFIKPVLKFLFGIFNKRYHFYRQ